MTMQAELKTLARDGVLRVAINTGNRALVQQDGDQLGGVSPALAKRLADQIGVRMEPLSTAAQAKYLMMHTLISGTWGFWRLTRCVPRKLPLPNPIL